MGKLMLVDGSGVGKGTDVFNRPRVHVWGEGEFEDKDFSGAN